MDYIPIIALRTHTHMYESRSRRSIKKKYIYITRDRWIVSFYIFLLTRSNRFWLIAKDDFKRRKSGLEDETAIRSFLRMFLQLYIDESISKIPHRSKRLHLTIRNTSVQRDVSANKWSRTTLKCKLNALQTCVSDFSERYAK